MIEQENLSMIEQEIDDSDKIEVRSPLSAGGFI